MAMVISNKTKMCMCTLLVLVLVGIGLAVASTMRLFDSDDHHKVGKAEMYSQWKSTPRTIDSVSNIN